jgi:hypothetical protein
MSFCVICSTKYIQAARSRILSLRVPGASPVALASSPGLPEDGSPAEEDALFLARATLF